MNFLMPHGKCETLLQQDSELKEKGITSTYIDYAQIEKAHHLAMGAALMWTESIIDLFPIFLINKTGFPFITSDDPICLYNYVKLKKHPILGLQSSGLQIYCPLNQKIVFLLIDKYCYHIALDDVRKADSTIYVTKKSDVDAINKLQILNCTENAVFSSQKHEQYLKELYPQTYGKHIRDVHWEADTYFTERPLHSKVSANYRLNLSFIRLNHEKNKQLKWIINRTKKTGASIEICRNQEISRILEKKL